MERTLLSRTSHTVSQENRNDSNELILIIGIGIYKNANEYLRILTFMSLMNTNEWIRIIGKDKN